MAFKIAFAFAVMLAITATALPQDDSALENIDVVPTEELEEPVETKKALQDETQDLEEVEENEDDLMRKPPGWLALAPWYPTFTPCTYFGVSCQDCSTVLVCTKFGAKLNACTDPLLPYCNLGVCTSVPPAQCVEAEAESVTEVFSM